MRETAAWKPVPNSEDLQTFEYSFGPGTARSFAALGPKGWVVVSPPTSAADDVAGPLLSRGRVAALVAPNAFHLMGLAPWRARFADVEIFAPEQSIARLHKKAGVSGIRPLSEAGDVCGASLELIDMPHYKTGEALVRAKTAAGPVWHVTDVIFNFAKVPPNLIAKLIFTVITDSAPGFKLSGPAAFIMMRNKKGVYRFLKDQAEAAPPVRIVPSHGADVVLDPPGEALIELLVRQGKI